MGNLDSKMKKYVLIFILVFGSIFSISVIYDIFFNDNPSAHFFLYFILFGGAILSFVAFIIVYGLKAAKDYRKKLMETQPRHRFKYIDTFYYDRIVYTGDRDNTSSTQCFAYNILEDVDSHKLYAIAGQNTNALLEVVLSKTKLLRNDNIDGFSSRLDWKEIDYNDEGSFWIDKELVGCFETDGENVSISYFGEKHVVKINGELHSRNNSDISLLSRATFITGFALFDKK